MESKFAEVYNLCLDFFFLHGVCDYVVLYYRDSRDSQNGLVELSLGQRVLLDVVIRTPFSEAIILPYLRAKLNLQHCLALLQYIAQCLPQTKIISDAQALMRWAAILLDSHYQQLLLSKDECVASTVHALKDLVESQASLQSVLLLINSNCMCVIVELLLQVEYMEELKMLGPILGRIKCGQLLQKPHNVQNNFYSVETLRLY